MKSCLGQMLEIGMAGVLGWQALAQSHVPMLIHYSGVLRDATAKASTGVLGVTFLLYQQQQGGAPLWMETQNVTPDTTGHYAVLLGAMSSDGLPAYLFADGDARWLAVQIAGQSEGRRVPLVAVPYAVKARDADTLGGLPASAFVPASTAAHAITAASGAKPEGARDVVPDTACTAIASDGTATANQVGKFTAPCTMEPSAIVESGGKVGIGTTTPAATLDVKGAATLRGTLTMNAKGAATAAAGANSNPLDLLAASFDSSTSTSISQHFRWQAEAAGNDTATPSGTLNLLYTPGGGTPAETGLSVNSKGLVTFVPGQTFPGGGTLTGVTAGPGLTGGGTAGTVNLALTTACASGQVLQWNGSAWACATPGTGTITGVTVGAGLSGSGTSGNLTLSNTGVLAVSAGLGITSSGGTTPAIGLNTGFTDGRYLQLAGGTLSGALTLPANGLTVAGNQLVLAGGNVGIGTATPGAPMEVAGNMKISGVFNFLTFPDGTTQTTAGSLDMAAGINPLQVALLKWFPAYQSTTFSVGMNPNGIAFDGTHIWVTNCSSNSVTELVAATGAVVNTVAVGTCPTAVAFDGVNIWVTNLYDGTVSSFAAAKVTSTNTITVGNGPNGIAFDGVNIWVTNEYSNNVTKVVASSGAVAGTFPVGNRPQGVAFDGANIWVANETDNTLMKLLPSTGMILGTSTVGMAPFQVAFDGTNIWVANYNGGTVTKVQAETGTVLNTFPVGVNPYGVAFDGTNIWVTNSGSNTVTKLLAATGQNLGTFSVGSSPYSVAFDGANIWVSNWLSNTVNKL